MSSGEIRGLPGFRDFFPEAFALRRHIFSAWRRVGARYGFTEYDGPPLEPLELYTRKSGEEIVGQLYAFEDKGGRAVALRPEMTPTFARMMAARAAGLPKPVRWFSIPQLFRYERPQRGRLREHFQLNMDIVGETDPLADAEIIAAGIDALRELGLVAADIVVRVSDRRLVAALLDALGIPVRDHLAVFAAIDRLEKEGEDPIRGRLAAAGVDGKRADRLFEALRLPLGELMAAHDGEGPLKEAAAGLKTVFSHLAAAGFGDFLRFDARLVRGLAYYTGTVFEIWDRRDELRAICGGGRYDDLLRALGGVDLPALGFGMGDVVLAELLRDRGLVPSELRRVDDYIICVSEDERPTALRLARALRDQGRHVLYDLRGRGVGRQFKAANQAGAARTIVLGPEEVGRGVVSLRDMASGAEREVAIEALTRAAEVERASPESSE
ncbi:histidine--tRNA ligase [Candidatus Palauibacter sp.]|uniref:histidine--tRNA ligase n=1 Tax=Candidatus Palauibacter sp. TaxID=3101350 RepID=UPI003CC6AC0E